MYLTTTNVGHPNLQKWKYALPGDENIFEIERIFINVESNLFNSMRERKYEMALIRTLGIYLTLQTLV